MRIASCLILEFLTLGQALSKRSVSTLSRRASFFRNGFLLTPLFFMWCHTNSSGLRSGEYPGRKYSSSRSVLRAQAFVHRAVGQSLQAIVIEGAQFDGFREGRKYRYELDGLGGVG